MFLGDDLIGSENCWYRFNMGKTGWVQRPLQVMGIGFQSVFFLFVIFWLSLPVGAQELRIVSLAPSITEIVCALGFEQRLVGVTEYCIFPESVKALPKVGGYIDPNLEVVVSLKPTIVLAAPEHRDFAAKLHRLSIDVITVKNYDLADFYASVRQISARLDAESAGEKLCTLLMARQTELEVKRKKSPQCLLALGHTLESQVKDVYCVGKGGYLNDLLALVGGRNVYQAGGQIYPKLSREVLLQLQPDLIIILVPKSQLSDSERKQYVDAWDKIPHLRAVSQRQVYVLNHDAALAVGPRYTEAMASMREILDLWSKPVQVR